MFVEKPEVFLGVFWCFLTHPRLFPTIVRKGARIVAVVCYLGKVCDKGLGVLGTGSPKITINTVMLFYLPQFRF